jgi:hypothetical protein
MSVGILLAAVVETIDKRRWASFGPGKKHVMGGNAKWL